MPFNPAKEVKDLKTVPEKHRGLYNEIKEGDKITGYKLDDEISKAIDGNDLKEENQKLRSEIKEGKDKFKELEDKINKQTKKNDDGQGELDLNKNKSKPAENDDKLNLLEKKFNNQIASMQKEMEGLKEEKQKLQEDAEKQKKQATLQKKESLVLESIREKGGSVALLKDHVMKNVSMDEAKSGKESIFAIDSEGLPKFQGSQKMGIDIYLDELKKDKDYSRAFDEKKKGIGLDNFNGSGTETKTGGEFSVNMSAKEEADYILKYGKDAYMDQTKKAAQESREKVQKAHEKASHASSNLIPN